MEETKLYTVPEVANILNVSTFTVYRMIQKGKLGALKVGQQLRINKVDLDNYLEKQKVGV